MLFRSDSADSLADAAEILAAESETILSMFEFIVF